ncbi:MAG: HAD family hydrolase [Lachnospiraceae bacterium]|nr:HAD family hydrolase [Lachnospiraceae bacterium]
MAIRWIVTDMDGTLLNEQDRISEATVQYLTACQKKGIRLVLASGRSFVRLMPYVRELQMEQYQGILIEVNGLAVNRLGTGERTVFAQLEERDVRRLASFLKEQDTEVEGYRDDTLYYWIPEWQREYKIREREERGYPQSHPLAADAWSWIAKDDFSHNYPNLIEVSSVDEFPGRLNKINCADTPERIEEIYVKLKEHFSNDYEIVRTCPRQIETAPRGITKGRTLKRLMEEEGIGRDEVLVFGDGENDIDMFRQVTHSIAMGNAAAYVKEHAAEITEGNGEEGLLKALKRYRLL